MTNDEPSGAEPIDEYDVKLLRRVGRTFHLVDPVPAALVERLQFGVTLEALHAEIAELSRVDGLVGARGDQPTEVQTVTFSSPNVTTMVTVSPSGADRVRIDGWIAPVGGLSVELRTIGDRRETNADSDGRFVFEDVPRGLAQFVLRHPESVDLPPVITPAVDL
ncbi:MAG: hypothetical protein QOC66_3431 [Pseudonocardiales bacterium]|nr:hypothetical protein [Pseudonocardiales bacterium]